MNKDYKLESNNVILNVKPKERDTWKRFVSIAREHLEELRDLLNDFLEMEKKGKI